MDRPVSVRRPDRNSSLDTRPLPSTSNISNAASGKHDDDTRYVQCTAVPHNRDDNGEQRLQSRRRTQLDAVLEQRVDDLLDDGLLPVLRRRHVALDAGLDPRTILAAPQLPS
jgi:hypothetical protein